VVGLTALPAWASGCAGTTATARATSACSEQRDGKPADKGAAVWPTVPHADVSSTSLYAMEQPAAGVVWLGSQLAAVSLLSGGTAVLLSAQSKGGNSTVDLGPHNR
jgi:hypothetical protein